MDATNVYWANCGTAALNYTDGSLMKVPLAGGTPTALISNENCPYAIAVDGTHLYWTGGAGDVKKIPKGGGVPTTLATGEGNAIFIAVDSASAYWMTYSTVKKVPINGGTKTTLGPTNVAAYPTGMALDATNIYWTGWQTPKVFKLPLTGGTPIELWAGVGASGVNTPYGIAVDATSVYWSDTATRTLMKVPIAGGAPTTILSSGVVGNLAIDAANIYFGSVQRVPLAGGSPTTLATGAGLNAVDSTSIYWLGANTVMKLTPK